MSIAKWPESERPREKLLRQGAAALNDSELLAIFLRTGVKGVSAVELARRMLRDFGSLSCLLTAAPEDFRARPGVGKAKYAQLMACTELVRRALSEQMRLGDALSSPQQVRDYLRLSIGRRDVEIFVVIFLSAQNRLIEVEEVFEGTLTETRVYPREVLRRALRYNAAAVIVAHNHPSGLSEPSSADRILTRTLKDALALVDIKLLDHFVVTGGRAESFAERGWL